VSKNTSDNVDEYLKRLIDLACSYPEGSKERQKELTEIIRVVTKSSQLWRNNSPYYEDALQQTWLHLCDNPERYEPDRGTVITWLSNYLKWQLSDSRKATWKEESRRVAIQTARTKEMYDQIQVNDEETWDLLARPDVLTILEKTRRWVETDSTRELRKTHIKGRPDVNCQILILLRLPPETRWDTIARIFDLPNSTAPSFYKRQALPHLRRFGVGQGYLD